MNQPPRTVKDLFPSKFLSAEDLKGRSATVTIEGVSFEDLRQRDGTPATKGIVHFVGKQKTLVLNKTQATAISEIAGSVEFEDWPGTGIQIAPGHAQNGKDTIVISRPPAPRSAPNTPPPTPSAPRSEPNTNGQTPTTAPVSTRDDDPNDDAQDDDQDPDDFDSWPSASATASLRTARR